MAKINYEEERRLTKALLNACGMSEEDADIAGDVVTHSDFTGVYSHGMSRLALYLKLFGTGAYNPKPNVTVLKDEGSILHLDCDNALGVVTINKAFDALLPKARQYGIAICTGRQSSNIGCASYYGWRAAKNDVICLVCCNTYLSMAPYGGADRLLGTNPIVVGVPTGSEYPVVMDISTSGVAFGKIQAYAREGKQLPEGWANDFDGKPTTDSKAAYTVLPIAAHKGYCLAVMVDIVSSVLSGASYGTGIGAPEKLEPENTGFCMIMIDPSKFMPIDEFKKCADDYVRVMKGSRTAEGCKEIFMPGEIEFKKFKENKESGMEVSEALAQELCGLAVKLGVLPAGGTFEELVASVR